MGQHDSGDDINLVQEALELRHDVELLAEQCRRLYERANRLVELTRHLLPPAVDGDGPAADVGVV